ncbi:MAG: DUF3078 domain-containing protein [Cyclobacteriaceae bacterium]|nr:DUF3078 domain-containing protein [Cyclobacteriaceae bacterium]
MAGGENQIGLVGIVKPVIIFNNDKWSWENDLDMRYGLQKIAADLPKKSEDVFRLESKLGRRISKKWHFSGIYTLNTQFAPSYDRTATMASACYLNYGTRLYQPRSGF